MDSKYSIKDLERLTGIKAHTIRIWEQRHELIVPKRTETNIRYYSDDDLRKLLNVSFLVHRGVKISKVAKLSDAELQHMVLEMSSKDNDYVTESNELKMAMFEYDQEAFEKTFDYCMSNYGEEETFTKVLGAFLEQLGILWQTQTVSVSHEHFVSNLIKQKLYSSIDRLKFETKKNAKTYLLYLPGNELHEIGLLHLQYVLKKKGERVIFLGQNTPLDYILEVYNKTPFDVVVGVFTTNPHEDDVKDYLASLKTKLNGHAVSCMFSGYQLNNLIESGYTDKSISLYKSLSELRKELIE